MSALLVHNGGMKNGRWQAGDLGPDGRRFVAYRKGCRNGEYWRDEDTFLIHDAKTRLNKWIRLEDGSKALEDAAYRAANPEKRRAATSAWSAANPDKRSATNARRRARKLAATSADHNEGIERVFHAMRIRLTECLRAEFHVDHLIPLAAGGKHHHTNLMTIPASLNLSKQDKTDYPMPACWLPACPCEMSA